MIRAALGRSRRRIGARRRCRGRRSPSPAARRWPGRPEPAARHRRRPLDPRHHRGRGSLFLRGLDPLHPPRHRRGAGRRSHPCRRRTGSTSEARGAGPLRAARHRPIDMGDFAGGTLKYLRRHPSRGSRWPAASPRWPSSRQGMLDLHSRAGAVDLDWLAERVAEAGGDALAVAAARTANTALECSAPPGKRPAARGPSSPDTPGARPQTRCRGRTWRWRSPCSTARGGLPGARRFAPWGKRLMHPAPGPRRGAGNAGRNPPNRAALSRRNSWSGRARARPGSAPCARNPRGRASGAMAPSVLRSTRSSGQDPPATPPPPGNPRRSRQQAPPRPARYVNGQMNGPASPRSPAKAESPLRLRHGGGAPRGAGEDDGFAPPRARSTRAPAPPRRRQKPERRA